MDVFDILDSLIILVILVCSFSPSCEIDTVDNLVEVDHHFVWKLRGKEVDSGSSIELVLSLIGKGLKFSNEAVHFSWGEAKMAEFFLSALCGANVLEGLFKCSGYIGPEEFICGGSFVIDFINGPCSPVLDPVFDIFSLDEPQKKHSSFHGVVDLVCTNIG